MSHDVDGDLVERLVDTSRYPLANPGSPAWERAVSEVRHDLRETGCGVLAEFVRPALHGELRDECAQLSGRANYDEQTVNVYNTAPDPTLPPQHPGRISMRRGNAFVARDQIPAESLIHRLYTSALFQRFLAGALGLPAVHPLADPYAGLCLNILRVGHEHPWHFDTNEFAVSMLTQAPEEGGDFEYCPGIRTPRSENSAEVRAVLTGDGGHLVRRLRLRPGDLQVFHGRYSLHRVGVVQGATSRHSAIFSYSERPGVMGTVVRTRQLFGRVASGHLAADIRRTDGLLD